MTNKKLFFFSFVILSCFLLLSGTLVYTNSEDISNIPNSIIFFAFAGVFFLIGAIGLFITSKEK